ncbi:hypothetical protein BJX76DRAFT_325763 [Aspergillus varians]
MASYIRKLLGFVGLSKERGDYKHLSYHEQSPRSLLPELPVDILLLIVPHLPLVSQACLALTCKSLYGLLRSCHDDERLAWPRFLASPLPSCELFGSQPHLPRTDLLLKQEDARWLYCCGCLKLHPNNHFTIGSIRVLPLRRYCKNRVGVADLCACLALTYLNGVRLGDWIQTGVPSQYLHQNIRQEFRFRVLDKRRLLIHNCSVTSQPDAFVALTTMVTLDPDNCLVVTTRYKVYWSTPHRYLGDAVDCRETYRTPYNTEPLFLCPHIHALAWLYGPYAPYLKSKKSCGLCDTKFRLLGCTDDGLHSVIQGERNLGIMRNDLYKRWRELDSSRRWWNGCRKPGNGMESLWYLRPWDRPRARQER